jgi:hypothetical protein
MDAPPHNGLVRSATARIGGWPASNVKGRLSARLFAMTSAVPVELQASMLRSPPQTRL